MEDLNQKKLRDKFIKSGVRMTGPETIFFFKRHKDWKKRNNRTLCCNWFQGKNWQQCNYKIFFTFRIL